MRHKLMMQRLEEKRRQRLDKLARDGSSYKTNKGQLISTVEIQNASRRLKRNQYQGNSEMAILYYKDQLNKMLEGNYYGSYSKIDDYENPFIAKNKSKNQ